MSETKRITEQDLTDFMEIVFKKEFHLIIEANPSRKTGLISVKIGGKVVPIKVTIKEILEGRDGKRVKLLRERFAEYLPENKL